MQNGCCSETDGNGLWFNPRYSVQQWENDWITMVQRYKNIPQVVAVDLRNEIRESCTGSDCLSPNWGGSNATLDWYLAATRMGNLIHQVNPDLLIVVEGLNYALDLTAISKYPIHLNISNKLVYSSHNYAWDLAPKTYDDLATYLDKNWGFIYNNKIAPVILGEFGTCHSSSSCVSDQPGTQGFWFQSLIQYLGLHENLNWFYWALDGTQSTGNGRTWNATESYGILNLVWNAPALPDLVTALAKVQN